MESEIRKAFEKCLFEFFVLIFNTDPWKMMGYRKFEAIYNSL